VHAPHIEAQGDQLFPDRKVAAGDFVRAIVRAAQTGQFRRNVPGFRDEQLAAHVEQATLAPDGSRHLLGNADGDAIPKKPDSRSPLMASSICSGVTL
jgi:hypothetical protein